MKIVFDFKKSDKYSSFHNDSDSDEEYEYYTSETYEDGSNSKSQEQANDDNDFSYNASNDNNNHQEYTPYDASFEEEEEEEEYRTGVSTTQTMDEEQEEKEEDEYVRDIQKYSFNRVPLRHLSTVDEKTHSDSSSTDVPVSSEYDDDDDYDDGAQIRYESDEKNEEEEAEDEFEEEAEDSTARPPPPIPSSSAPKISSAFLNRLRTTLTSANKAPSSSPPFSFVAKSTAPLPQGSTAPAPSTLQPPTLAQQLGSQDGSPAEVKAWLERMVTQLASKSTLTLFDYTTTPRDDFAPLPEYEEKMMESEDQRRKMYDDFNALRSNAWNFYTTLSRLTQILRSKACSFFHLVYIY